LWKTHLSLAREKLVIPATSLPVFSGLRKVFPARAAGGYPVAKTRIMACGLLTPSQSV